MFLQFRRFEFPPSLLRGHFGRQQPVVELQFCQLFVQPVDFLVLLLEEGVGLLVGQQSLLEPLDFVFLQGLQLPQLGNLVLQLDDLGVRLGQIVLLPEQQPP